MTTVEQARGDLAAAAQSGDLSDDKARAERVAAARRHKRQLHNFIIRIVSLALAPSSWLIAGRMGSTSPMPMKEIAQAKAIAQTAVGWRHIDAVCGGASSRGVTASI